MNLRFAFAIFLALTACAQPPVVAPLSTTGTIAVLSLKPGQKLPKSENSCWTSDVAPAVIETVTEQIVLSEEIRDAAGNITTPASYRTNTHQRMVQDSREVWFRVPCPEVQNVTFIASLQRALKARALYLDAVTGELNPATADAIRRFQQDRGLDSATLSLVAAQELGLLATDISQL